MRRRISTTEAVAHMAERHGIVITVQTMIKWCRDYEIGVRPGGHWKIDPDALDRLVETPRKESEDGKGE